uniref:Uncharacterized protein n=1 Tax=Arundo donax TaxID=35708 RepID=A0A0A9FMG4_ARUDO
MDMSFSELIHIVGSYQTM